MKLHLQFKSIMLIVSFTLFSCATAFAQQTVSGTVKDASNNTLPGVNVLVKGTTQGASTDVNGHYEVTAPSKSDTLVFSFIGYQTRRVPIKGRSKINVTLMSKTISGEEMVVVGYGSQRREDITGSISSADVDEISKTSTQSIANALDGKVAGVHVQTSGAPGESPAINVRGIGTFGDNTPLYIVDGIQVPDIIDFDPSQFQSVQVLKDAAASAIYGSRAANGVVIIETKKGKPGKLSISYKGTYGTENVYQRINMLQRKGYQALMREELQNAGKALSSAKADDPNSKYFIDNINTDWQNEAWQRGYSTKQALDISGGDKKSTYLIGGTYENNEGTFNGDAPSYKTLTAKANSTHKMGRVTIGENIWLTRSVNTPQTSILNNGQSQVNETLHSLPIIPVYDSNRLGGFGGPRAGIEQGIALNTIGVNHLMDRKQYVDRGFINAWAKVNILDNLTYKLNLAYDSRDYKENWFEPTYDLGFFFFEREGHLQITRNHTMGTTMEHTLDYSTDINKHSIDILAGFSEENNTFKQEFSAGTGYSRPFIKVLNGASSTRSSGFKSENSLRSFYGRIQYNYDNRYLATASFRRDGSSRFGDGNKWGNFPSFSVGWRISNEDFFNIPWVKNLKLRASWGKVGNQAIGDYETIPTINSFSNYTFNDQIAQGAVQVSLVNKNLKWEVLTSRTIGIDTRLFNNALDLTIEYFNNDSKDILVGVPLPGSMGSATNPVANAASINNSGIGITAGYRHQFGDLDFNISADISTLHNEVTSVGGENAQPIYGFASKTAVGHEVGEIYGYVTDGIFQNQSEINNHATQEPGTAPGDIRFKDLNNDGVIDANDRTYLGSPTPDFTYGVNMTFNYHGFDASMFFQGNYGNKIFDAQRRVLENMGDYDNQTVRVYKNRWTSNNKTNNVQFPRAVWGDPNNNNRDSNRWVENGSYLRLENMTVGYTIPTKGKFGVRTLRAFITAENLFTITAYKGLDPELGTSGGTTANSSAVTNISNNGLFNRGVDDGAWPHPRTFRLGLQLKF